MLEPRKGPLKTSTVLGDPKTLISTDRKVLFSSYHTEITIPIPIPFTNLYLTELYPSKVFFETFWISRRISRTWAMSWGSPDSGADFQRDLRGVLETFARRRGTTDPPATLYPPRFAIHYI